MTRTRRPIRLAAGLLVLTAATAAQHDDAPHERVLEIVQELRGLRGSDLAPLRDTTFPALLARIADLGPEGRATWAALLRAGDANGRRARTARVLSAIGEPAADWLARELVEGSGHSLGAVQLCLVALAEMGEPGRARLRAAFRAVDEESAGPLVEALYLTRELPPALGRELAAELRDAGEPQRMLALRYLLATGQLPPWAHGELDRLLSQDLAAPGQGSRFCSLLGAAVRPNGDDARLVALLERAVRGVEDPDDRRVAIHALGSIGTKRSRRVLEELIGTTSDEPHDYDSVPYQAGEALEATPSTHAVADLHRLMSAASAGDVPSARAAITALQRPVARGWIHLDGVRDLDGRTALDVAAGRGDLELVRALSPLFGDGTGAAAYAAAFGGHAAVVDALREAWDFEPIVALNHALAGGHASTIDLLLPSIDDLDRRPPEPDEYDLAGQLPQRRLSPLEFAARSGNVAAITQLLAAGARADRAFLADFELHTAAGQAARAGHADALTLLLDSGASLRLSHEWDGDEYTFSLLCLAAESGNPDLVDLLLDRGSEVDERDGASYFLEARTPLMVAAKYGHPALTRRLLQRGADPNARCSGGWPVLRFALDAYAPGRDRDPAIEPSVDPAEEEGHRRLQVVEVLIEAGAALDGDVIDAAVGTGSIALVEHLIERGLDLSAPSELAASFDSEDDRVQAEFYGRLVELRPGPSSLACVGLRAAIEGEDLEMLSLLLPHARKVDVEPLSRVFEENKTEIALALIEHGFDFEAALGSPWTPSTALVMAARHGNAVLVEAMLEAGADPNRLDADGDTALTVAIDESGRSGPVQFLGGPDFLYSGQLRSWERRSGNFVETVRVLLAHGADTRQPAPALPDGLLQMLEDLQEVVATRDDGAFLLNHLEEESLQALLDQSGSADAAALMESSAAGAHLVPLLAFYDQLLKHANQHEDLWTRDLALREVPYLAVETDNGRLTPDLYPTFRTQGSFTATLQLPEGLATAQRRALLHQLSERIGRAPGVSGCVYGSYVPFLDEPVPAARIDHETSDWNDETEVVPIEVATFDVSHDYFARLSMAFQSPEGGFSAPRDRPSVVVSWLLAGNELHMHLLGDDVVLDGVTCALAGRLLSFEDSAWRGDRSGERSAIAFRDVYESDATQVGVLIDTSRTPADLTALLATGLEDLGVALVAGSLRDLDAALGEPVRAWASTARGTENAALFLSRRRSQGGMPLRRTPEGWRVLMPGVEELQGMVAQFGLVPVGSPDPSSLDLEQAMRTHGLLLAAGRVEHARALVRGQLSRPEHEVRPAQRFAMLNALANDELQLGRFRESEAALRASLDALEGERDFHEAAALVHSNLIVLHGLTGDAEASAASEAALDRALRVSVEELNVRDRQRLARDVEALLVLHGNLANHRILSGRYELARRTLDQADELLDLLDGKDSASGRQFQLLRGNLALFSGHVEVARTLYQDLILSAEARSSEQDLMHAMALGSLSMVEEHAGRWVEARRLRSRSIERMQALLGEDSPDHGLALIQAGDLALRAGDVAAGLEHYTRAAAILERIGSSNLGTALIGAGTAEALGGDHQRALATLARAERAVRGAQGGDHRNYAAVCAARGAVHVLSGDLESARGAIEASLAIYEQERGQFTNELDRREYLGTVARAYQALVALQLHPADLDAAFETVERFRAKSLMELLTSERVSRTDEEEAEVLAELDRVRQDLRLMEATAEPSIEASAGLSAIGSADRSRQQIERRRELGARRAGLLANLRSLNPELAGTLEAAHATADEVRAALTEGEVLVEYFEAVDLEGPQSAPEPRLMAFVLTRETVQVREVAPSSRAVMDQAVIALTRIKASRGLGYDGDDEVAATPSFSIERCQELYDLLLAPLAGQLTGERLTIVPTGGLHYLPWAALHDGERYLSERCQVAVAPSASVLVQLRSRPAPAGRGLLALGNPDGHLGRLAGAQAEVEAIAGLFDDPTIRMGAAATEDALRSAARSPRIVHVASHGVFDATRPELSHLALTPESTEDGRLEVHEAYGLPFDETELVVLSACNTATGVHSGGDEVVGLSRAFFVSGARTVVSSLWSVPDAATATLMVAMYEELLGSGASPSEALRRAQARLRADPRTAHPYYWAGFQVMGLGW